MAETLSKKENILPELINKQYKFDVEDDFKIATIGDMHLHHSTPASRIDDYPDTCIQKLRIVRRYLNDINCKFLFCEGDTFHIPKERTDFEYRVIEEFYRFKEDGINVFEIVGNHSIINDRIDSIDRTSLGIMYLTGALLPYTKVEFNRKTLRKVEVTATNFPNEIEPVSQFDSYNINVCHKFYEVSLDSNSLMKKDLHRLGYNMYLCGHDHVVYPLTIETTQDGLVHIVRPGSFMRGTAHKYNTERMVYMDVINFSKSLADKGKQVEVERVTLPVKEPKEIFSATVIDKNENKKLKDMTEELANLVDKLYSQETTNLSVYDVLDNSVLDAKIKARIVEYLEQFGIFRK